MGRHTMEGKGMTAAQAVGSVTELWRFPVKSMKGERVEQAEVTERGVVGDRAYALIDVDTGKVASAKSVKLFPNLLACRSEFVEQPRSEGEAPPVRVTLPDGTSVISDSSDAHRVLSRFFGREVRLARPAPADFTIDQYHPDIEDVDPAGGHRRSRCLSLRRRVRRGRGAGNDPDRRPRGNRMSTLTFSASRGDASRTQRMANISTLQRRLPRPRPPFP